MKYVVLVSSEPSLDVSRALVLFGHVQLPVTFPGGSVGWAVIALC